MKRIQITDRDCAIEAIAARRAPIPMLLTCPNAPHLSYRSTPVQKAHIMITPEQFTSLGCAEKDQAYQVVLKERDALQAELQCWCSPAVAAALPAVVGSSLTLAERITWLVNDRTDLQARLAEARLRPFEFLHRCGYRLGHTVSSDPGVAVVTIYSTGVAIGQMSSETEARTP